MSDRPALARGDMKQQGRFALKGLGSCGLKKRGDSAAREALLRQVPRRVHKRVIIRETDPCLSWPEGGDGPRVAIAAIVLNEAEFLPRWIEQHIHWPGLVCMAVVEGCASTYADRNPDAATGDGLSTDDTSDILSAAADKHGPMLEYIPHGWASTGGPRQEKRELRDAYCKALDGCGADILIVIDGDEFYTRADQRRINELVAAHPDYLSWRLNQRHLWRPPSVSGDGMFTREVSGGYWSVPHVRAWRWRDGSRYLTDHNFLEHPEQPHDPARMYRSREGDPECIHLGFARAPEGRLRTNAYYVHRGEGRESKGRGRGWYVDCRRAWESWAPGDELPQGARVASYTGPVPECYRPPRVGMMGFCVPTGLGYENRRMWRKLPLASWLVWAHPRLGHEGSGTLGRRSDLVLARRDGESVDRWLDSIDVLVSAERVYPDDLHRRAKQRGIRTVLLVNPEWFWPHKKQDVTHIDVLVARTRWCYEWLLQQSLPCEVVYVPCPLDLGEWPYRERTRAGRFKFSNGWGGVHGRKGWTQVREVLLEDCDAIEVQSQAPITDAPHGATIQGATPDAAGMYDACDVAVQPSHWEGVGLCILEAMASGCPVITTDAEPMRQYVRDAHGDDADRLLIPVAETVTVMLWRGWQAHRPDARILHQRIQSLRGEMVDRLSSQARGYIERVHGESAWLDLWSVITGDRP